MGDQLGLDKEHLNFSSVKSMIETIRRGDVPPTVCDANRHGSTGTLLKAHPEISELQFNTQHALQEVRHDGIYPISRLICVFKPEEYCSKGRQGHTNAVRCPPEARSSKGIRGCRDPNATRREA
jgi:hypothetical protein